MRRAGTHLLVAWLVAFLCGAPVRAAPALVPSPDFYATKGGTRLLVLVAPLDARAKAQLGFVEHTAEIAVDATDRFEAVRGIDALDPSAANARAAKEQEARKLMAEAKQALDDLDSAKASKMYTDAIAAWQAADLTRGIEGLVEAWTGKAAGHSVSEENPQAKAELEKVLVLAPKTKFSDAQFPPELLKYAESQRTKMGRAKGKLTVRTEPPGANVWVDGAYRGTSPVTVEQVAGGQHMVVAGLSGFSMAVDDLPPGDQLLKLKPAELSYQHQTALDRTAKDPDGPARDAAARELGDTARADQVLLLVVKKGAGPDTLDAVGVRLDVKDGHNFSYKTGTFSSQLVRDLLELDDPRIDRKPTTHFAGGSSGGLSGKRIAGIGLLGGAVVAAASWAIFGFSALNRATVFKNTFQIEAMKSNQAATQGRTFALVADISWAVGAVLLVVGVLLAFTPLGRSGPAEKPKPKQPDPLEEYRRQQEEQRRLDEERAKQKAAEEEKKPAPPPPDEQKPAEEKKPDPAPQPQQPPAPPPEEKKKTPAEERAEKKRKAQEEKAEKKRKAEEEKAERKRKEQEEKQRQADEKKKAEEEKKRAAEEKAKADEEKKRAAEEDKKRSAEEDKKRSAEEKKKAEEDKKRAAEEEKQKKADEEKKKAEDEQRQKDEAEARRLDEERKKKEEEKRKREDEELLRKDREQEKQKDQDKPKDRPKPDEEDLRNF